MKRSVKMIALLLVLALLAGGTVLVQKMTETQSVSESEGSFALAANKAEELTGLSWTHEDVSYHFVKKDGAWKNADDPDFPASTDAVQEMAVELAALTAVRKLEEVGDLAGYGLDEPVFAITAEWADGTSTTYRMGAETPFGGSYYVSSGEEGVLYAVEDALDELFGKTGTELASLEEIPVLEDPDRLVITGVLDIHREEASLSIDPEQLWYTAEGAPVSNSEAGAKITAANGILWNELLSAGASEEELAAWNLTEETATAITLYEDGAIGLTVLIGAQDEAGNYYARLPQSSMVYTVTSSEVNTLLTADAEALRVKELMPLAYENVQQAQITAESGTFAFSGAPAQPETTEEPAEETAEETAQEAQEEEEDPAETLWALITELAADSYAQETAQGDALLTITASNAAGISQTLAFYAYDADSYLVALESGESALTDAAAVDRIIRMLRQLV